MIVVGIVGDVQFGQKVLNQCLDVGICIVKYVIKKVSDRVYEVWELS